MGDGPDPRYGHSALSRDGERMLIFGGSNRFPQDFLNDLWEYDRILQRWITIQAIEDRIFPRRYVFHGPPYMMM